MLSSQIFSVLMTTSTTTLLVFLGGLLHADGLSRIDKGDGSTSSHTTGTTDLPNGLVHSIDTSHDVQEIFMEQRLDHFDRQQLKTFRQRYFINKKHWAGSESGAPVFVCVGGEGPPGLPLDATILSENNYCNDMVELAPAHNALLLALEHRYYGKSNPGEDWATESLRWLSSQQALADLVTFREYIVEKEALTGQEKWVTWAASYPGMLSGWARFKYPHLFHAAVSSSSPLLAEVEFTQYAELVRADLATSGYDIGGSEACAAAVETGAWLASGSQTICVAALRDAVVYAHAFDVTSGHAKIGELLDTKAGRQELVTTFNLCQSSCLDGMSARKSFAGDGVVTLTVAYNDPADDDSVFNIKAMCEIMTDDERGSEVQRLAALRKIQRNASGEVDDPCEMFPPLDHRRQSDANARLDVLRPLESLEVLPAKHGSWASDPSDSRRAWLYQTCTEFGYFKTCNVGSGCPFTQGLHTLDLDFQLCEEAFGITPDQVREQVRFTNAYYGGIHPSGSRVIFPNGAIDPWHALGMLKTISPDLPALYVEGASHHFWTHPSKPTDSLEVVRAREIIWDQVTEWLREDD